MRVLFIQPDRQQLSHKPTAIIIPFPEHTTYFGIHYNQMSDRSTACIRPLVAAVIVVQHQVIANVKEPLTSSWNLFGKLVIDTQVFRNYADWEWSFLSKNKSMPSSD